MSSLSDISAGMGQRWQEILDLELPRAVGGGPGGARENTLPEALCVAGAPLAGLDFLWPDRWDLVDRVASLIHIRGVGGDVGGTGPLCLFIYFD